MNHINRLKDKYDTTISVAAKKAFDKMLSW